MSELSYSADRRFIFVTGLAGSGKSLAMESIAQILSARGFSHGALSDEEYLFQIIEEDKGRVHHFYPDGGKKFLFKDNYVFDEGLRRINKVLVDELVTPANDFVLVELARGRRIPPLDVTFEHAFKFFDQEVINQAIFLYVQAPFNARLERNKIRAGTTSEHTPIELMKTIYAVDDIDWLRETRVPLFLLENSGDIEDYMARIKTTTLKILGPTK